MSKVWENFKKIPGQGKAKCNHCNVILSLPKSGSTGNFLQHLKKHPDVKLKSSDTDVFFRDKDVLPSVSHSAISAAFAKGSEMITSKKLVEFVCSSGIPLNCLNNPYLKEFCASLNSGYEMPSRSKVRALIGKHAAQDRASSLECAGKARFVVLSSDCWTSPKSRVSLMAVYAHFLEPSLLTRSIKLIDCLPLKERHTGKYLAEVSKGIVERLPSVKFVVGDGASNLQSFVAELDLSHIYCAAHKINLVVAQFLKDEELQPIVAKVSRMIKKLNRSGKARSAFKEICCSSNKPLVQPAQSCSIRWSSCYCMLVDFLENIEVFDLFCKQEGLEFPTVENCDSLKFCRLALKPFYEATLKVSRTDESAGLVLFVYQVLVDHANSLKETCRRSDRSLAELLSTVCEKYLVPCFHDTILQYSALCDPRAAFLPKIFKADIWNDIMEAFVSDKALLVHFLLTRRDRDLAMTSSGTYFAFATTAKFRVKELEDTTDTCDLLKITIRTTPAAAAGAMTTRRHYFLSSISY